MVESISAPLPPLIEINPNALYLLVRLMKENKKTLEDPVKRHNESIKIDLLDKLLTSKGFVIKTWIDKLQLRQELMREPKIEEDY